MKRSGPDLKRRLPEPEQCRACKGTGVTQGVFYELDCYECVGIGWLPVAGVDLTKQLGSALSKAMAHNRLLQAVAPKSLGAAEAYQRDVRSARGNYTGD